LTDSNKQTRVHNTTFNIDSTIYDEGRYAGSLNRQGARENGSPRKLHHDSSQHSRIQYSGVIEWIHPGHRRFNAFLRFSAPGAPGAAPRFTALDAVWIGTAVATLESAVPSGEGEGRRSFKFFSAEREVVLMLDGEDFSGDAGGAEVAGAEGLSAGVLEGVVASGDGDFVADGLEVTDGPPSEDAVDGGSNSGGRVFGVACTLVISFAREK